MGSVAFVDISKATREKSFSKHTDFSTFRWVPVSLFSSLARRTIDNPWNMIWAGAAIEFRPYITCFADTYKNWNSTISKTCLHTHSPNPRLKHSHLLTIMPTPTLTPSRRCWIVETDIATATWSTTTVTAVPAVETDSSHTVWTSII